jgi:Ulp1 family protease
MYLCSCHWSLAIICSKVGNIFTLDPLDVDQSTYKEFVNCIQR